MLTLLAARLPPGEAFADVMQVMAKHRIAFACSTDPDDVAPFLRNAGYKAVGVPENRLLKKSGDQAISSGDQGRPSFAPDSHLETHVFENTDVQVSASPNTLKVPQAIHGFSRQKDVKDTVIQFDAFSNSLELRPLLQHYSHQVQEMDTVIENLSIYPSGASDFGHGQQQAPDFTSNDSPLGSTKIIPDAKFIQQTVEKVPMGARISTKQPEVKEEHDQSSSVNKLQPEVPNGATKTPFSKNSIDQFDAVSKSPGARPLLQGDSRQVQDMDTVLQKPPPPSSSVNDIFGRDQQYSPSILTTPENRFGRGDVVSGANPEPMDFDMPPFSSSAPMLHDEPVDIFDGIKPPIDLDAPRLFLGEIDLTEELVKGTAVKEEMEDGEENLIDSGAHVDPKDKDNKPKDLRSKKTLASQKKSSLNIKTAPKKKASAKKKKTFSCEVCKKEFSGKSYQKRHLLIHTGEKPHECNVCQKRFRNKNHLTNHLRTHTGEKPFECDVCKTRFTVKCGLDRHMRTHTGEKPYECKDCEKKFADNNTLKIHRIRHHV